MRALRAGGVVGVTLLALAGCATARLNQFRGFSQAGAAYVKASETFIAEAGDAAIRGDSAVLARARADLTPAERRRQVLESNRMLRERLLVLRQIGAHARLLRDYFEVLGAMADSKSPETLAVAARSAFEAVAQLSPAIQDARIGNSAVAPAIPPVVSMVVARFRVKALEAELKQRAALVERELALQEAALSVLAREIATDLTVALNLAESREVNEPFATAADLPKDWTSRRLDVLNAQAASRSAGAAAEAARKLRESFARLVANQWDEASLSGLLADVNAVVELATRMKGSNAP
jgi:hypothetical protein